MNKAVFLDRDGTINADKDYLYKIEDFEYLPGVIDALRIFQKLGYLLIVITNQSGIARGYYSEEDFYRLNQWMISDLTAKGINISKTYYCPHHPNASIEKYQIECNCRKPRIGMFQQAIREFNLDIRQCIAIGDKIRDCSICMYENCIGYLIGNNEKIDIINEVKKSNYPNIRYESDLLNIAMRYKKLND